MSCGGLSIRLGVGGGDGLGAPPGCTHRRAELLGDQLGFEGVWEAEDGDESLCNPLISQAFCLVIRPYQAGHRHSQRPVASLLRRLPVRGSEQTPDVPQAG